MREIPEAQQANPQFPRNRTGPYSPNFLNFHIEIGQCSLQYLTVARVAGGFQLLQDALSREQEAIDMTLPGGLLRGQDRTATPFVIHGFGLLRFYRLAFPSACHRVIIRG